MRRSFPVSTLPVLLLGIALSLTPVVGSAAGAAERPDAEKVLAELLQRLDRIPDLRSMDDTGFLKVVRREREDVLARLAAEDPATYGEHVYGETLYPIVRFYRRYDLARRLMLEVRRQHRDPAIRDWAFTELVDIERQQILARAGRVLPDSTLTAGNGTEPGEVAARYSFGRGGALFVPASTDSRTAETLRQAQAYEEEAARLVQMGNKNAAVRMIDLAAHRYASLHRQSEFACGPMIWAARYVRDLGLPLAAMVRYRQVLLQLGEAVGGWRGIVLEDLGDLQCRIGQGDLARRQYEEARAIFARGGNAEGAERVAMKIGHLDHHFR
ncbi:MAG: hypothetical protein GX442_04455 [Candidatus Riflebacteria bacterium]|nr:hypothetical protein [Candidatus Riflebacteria bacterium]